MLQRSTETSDSSDIQHFTDYLYAHSQYTTLCFVFDLQVLPTVQETSAFQDLMAIMSWACARQQRLAQAGTQHYAPVL